MTWTPTELDRIGAADELDIITRRPDGTVRAAVPIWVVRVGDELFVRSYRGAGGAWYRHALHDPDGRVSATGIDRDVTFEPLDTGPETETETIIDAISRAYRAKYARYGDTYLQPMLTGDAVAATLRLTTR